MSSKNTFFELFSLKISCKSINIVATMTTGVRGVQKFMQTVCLYNFEEIRGF